MTYFIPWVVFLLFVILSVPITAWLGKPKSQGGGELEDDHEASFEDAGEPEFEEAAAADEPAEVEPAFDQAADFGAGGEDDFSAFEEIR